VYTPTENNNKNNCNICTSNKNKSSALLEALFTDDSRDSFPGKDIYPKAKVMQFLFKKRSRGYYI